MFRTALIVVAVFVAATAAPVPPNFPQDVLANMNLSADPCNDFYGEGVAWNFRVVLFGLGQPFAG
jgi:hypothetical protein